MESEKNLYHVIIASAVSDRMYDHFEFLARVSETAARKLLDGLVKDINSLEQMLYHEPLVKDFFSPLWPVSQHLSAYVSGRVKNTMDDC